jgi:hypothetical protein
MPSIPEIIRLMRGDAITPQDALSMHLEQEAAQKERRIARKQAMAEAEGSALDSLAETSLRAAGEPTDLQGVMRAFGAEQLFASGDAESALDQLFLPTGQTNFPGNAGLSRINPTLPADEYSKMFKAAVEDARDGLEPAQTMNRLLNQARQNLRAQDLRAIGGGH